MTHSLRKSCRLLSSVQLNRRIGKIYTINGLEMVLGNVSNPLNIHRLECLPTPLPDEDEEIEGADDDDDEDDEEEDVDIDEEEEEREGGNVVEGEEEREGEEGESAASKAAAQRKRKQEKRREARRRRRSKRRALCEDGENPEDLVRVLVDFHYSNTLQLKVDGTQHTGRGE